MRPELLHGVGMAGNLEESGRQDAGSKDVGAQKHESDHPKGHGIRNDNIRESLGGGGVDIMDKMREHRLWWFGHVMRWGGGVRAIQGLTVEGRRGRGKDDRGTGNMGGNERV